jgi:hypothetical protein
VLALLYLVDHAFKNSNIALPRAACRRWINGRQIDECGGVNIEIVYARGLILLKKEVLLAIIGVSALWPNAILSKDRFARLISRIRRRISPDIFGRPPRERDFQRQY